jgi:hypothetical protein
MTAKKKVEYNYDLLSIIWYFSLSSLMSDLPDLQDIDFSTLTNGMDSFSDSGTSYSEDVVDFKR